MLISSTVLSCGLSRSYSSPVFSSTFSRSYSGRCDILSVFYRSLGATSFHNYDATLAAHKLCSSTKFVQCSKDAGSKKTCAKDLEEENEIGTTAQVVPIAKLGPIEPITILRPLSPHLSIYKPQLTSMFSICHRISVAFLVTIVFFFYLLYLKMGLICFTYYNFYLFCFYSSKLILISVEITALALSYHLYKVVLGFLVWLFNRTLSLIKKEQDVIDIFLKLSFIFLSFLFFVSSYQYFDFLPEVEEEPIKKDLVNPLQVVVQLSCFFFFFKYKRSDVRERQLILTCLLLSVLSTLYILKVKAFFFAFLISVVFSISVYVYKINLDYAPLAVLLFYSVDDGLAKWGFFLIFQQLCFYMLSISLEKNPTVPQKGVIKRAIYLQSFLFFLGIIRGDCYFSEPAKLVALLSGASIVFICLKKRRPLSFLFAFSIYFFASIFIGIASLQGPLDLTGFWIFLMGHLVFLCGLFLFVLPSERLPIVPFLFYALFYILPSYPSLAWLSKWIEGLDILLLILSIFSFVEESKGKIEEEP